MSLIFFPALRRFDFLFMFELHRGFLCFNFHAREFFLPLFFLLLLRSYLPIRCPQMMFLETLGRRRPGQLWAAVWQQQGQRQRQGRRWRHPTSSGRLPSFLAKLVAVFFCLPVLCCQVARALISPPGEELIEKKLIYSFVTLTFKFCSLSCVGLLTTNYLGFITHVTYNSPKRSSFLLCNV